MSKLMRYWCVQSIVFLALFGPLVVQAATIKVLGSTSLKPVIDHIHYIIRSEDHVSLAKVSKDRLLHIDKQFNEEYRQRVREHFSGESLSIRPGGSALGLRAVLTQNADVGLISRDLLPVETQFNSEITNVNIGYDAVVFFVNSNNPTESLSTQQLSQIFSGSITDWSEVGEGAGRIELLGKGSHHGTYDVFVDALGLNDNSVSEMKTFETEAQISVMIGKRLKNGIAFGSLGALPKSTVRHHKLITVDGIHPLEEQGGINPNYPFLRSLNIVVLKGRNQEASIQKLIDFLVSADGRTLLNAYGYIVPTPN